MKKLGIKTIWIMFAVYFIAFVLISGSTLDNQLVWTVLGIWAAVMDIILLIKHGFPGKDKIILSIALAVIYLVSCMLAFGFGTITVFPKAVLIFFSGCAVFAVSKQNETDFPLFVRNKKKSDILFSILLGIVTGAAWGGLNYLLMKGSNPISPANPFSCFLVSLNPAISEELVNRSVFYAFCLSLSGEKSTKKSASFTCWFMMMIPHILPHTADAFSGGIVNWIITVALYTVIFGALFAFLQKKRDMLSAMVAHGTVDFIRFCIFGLPI